MSPICGVLVDLSGTLHIGDTVVSGAIQAIERLRATGLPFRFCTNTTKESSTSLVARLQRLGFQLAPHEVFTSLNAAATLLRTCQLNPLLLLEEDAAASVMQGLAGSMDRSAPHNAVLVGLAPKLFHYEKLNEAFHLVRSGCPLIAVHKARYFARESGLALGPGPFVAALEYATGVEAQVVGKPERTFFEMAIHDMGLENVQAGQVAMIGDDVEQDLGGGAIELGLERFLVRTGKYQTGDEDRAIVPVEHVVPSIVDAVNLIVQRVASFTE